MREYMQKKRKKEPYKRKHPQKRSELLRMKFLIG